MQKTSFVGVGLATCLLLASTTYGAVDVTVNSTQPEVAGSNYQTINAALTYVKTQTEPRTVRITGGGPYTESFFLNFSVTVKGDGYRPVIAAPPITGAPGGSIDGNAIGLCTTAEFTGPQTFRLENLVVLPAIGNPPFRGIRSNNNDGGNLTIEDMTVEIVDVLITANNGSNQPVTTDGLSEGNPAGATFFGDDLMFFAGYVDVACTGTISTNSYGASGANPDGLVFVPDVQEKYLHIGPGCVFSYCNRIGIQVAGDGSLVSMIGTEADPIIFKGNWKTAVNNAALSFFADDNGLGTVAPMEHVLFLENNSRAIGVAFIDDLQSVTGIDATDLAFVGNGEAALALLDDLRNAWTFDKTTIVNNGLSAAPVVPPILSLAEESAGGSNGSVTFTDSIVAGDGTDGDAVTGDNLIRVAAPSLTVSFVNSGLPTVGPFKLGTGKYLLENSAPAPTETNVLSVDPEFVAVNSDFANANFLDVAAAAYDNAATGGADLSGYGDWVGGSSVDAWSLY